MLANLLARRLPDVDVAKGRALVKAGGVYVGHLRIRVPTVRVVPGERITVWPQALHDEELPLSILSFVHRDETFVVLDKPAGIPVAATRQSARGTLAEALRRYLEQSGWVRPYVGVVHRLDRGASGLVLFTIRDIANKSLHKQFVEHRIERFYRLRVHGDAPPEATCAVPILERSGGARAAEHGESRAKPAFTSFRRLDPRTPMKGTSLLEAIPQTGRTHQIRIHAAALGLPLVGDRRHGDPEDPAPRLFLHAARLRFEHPRTGAPLDLRAPLPDWATTPDDLTP